MINLSPTANQILALLLLLLIMLLPVFLFIVPLANYYIEKYEQVDIQAQRLSRMESLLLLRDNIESEIGKMADMESDGNIFIQGDKVSIASANLRELVSEVVSSSGGRLVSSQEYEADSISSATPVGLQVVVTGEIDNLVDLLYTLENSKPLIFIDDFSIVSKSSKVRSKRSERKTGKREIRSGRLDIRFSVVGYIPGLQP